MVQHLQQPAKATLNKHIWNILQSWNFEHQHPPHPTDNISPPQHPATISHSILRPRPFSAPGLTLRAHRGHGASGRLDPTFQHHIITSEVKSNEERKLATEPPGIPRFGTECYKRKQQSSSSEEKILASTCWRLLAPCGHWSTCILPLHAVSEPGNLACRKNLWHLGGCRGWDTRPHMDRKRPPLYKGIQLHHAASGTSTIIEHWEYRPMDTQCVRFECPDHQVQLIATPKSRCGKGRLEVGIYDSSICCIWMYPQNSKSNTKVLHNKHFSLPIWCI